MQTKFKQQILELKKQGKTEKEIVDILGCNRSTVQFHCSPNGKKNRYNTNNKWKNDSGFYNKINPIDRKLNKFLYRKQIKSNRNFTNNNYKYFIAKLGHFHRKGIQTMLTIPTKEEIINKFNKNPACYLTGEPLDITKPSTYQFDHIIPASRGGDNSLDNLGICTKQANLAKSDMTPDEFFNFCKKVLEHQGYHITKNN